jgi:hypothetical protein
MFWKKKAPEAVDPAASTTEEAKAPTGTSAKSDKLPKPRDIEPRIGGQLVLAKKQKPDTVWRLKSVRIPFPGVKDRFYFRVFDDVESANKGVNIKNYYSLDEHPDFIIWEGWFDKETNQVEFTEKDTKSK